MYFLFLYEIGDNNTAELTETLKALWHKVICNAKIIESCRINFKSTDDKLFYVDIL